MADILKITDLKDMLKKTGKLYGEKTAYKIKISDNNYKIYTHKQIRNMIDALRNMFNRFRT